MNRVPVKSSMAREVGHDETGMEVQFHAKGCGILKGCCDCSGGEVYHYPEATPEHHTNLMAAESFGRHFAQHIRPLKGVKRP